MSGQDKFTSFDWRNDPAQPDVQAGIDSVMKDVSRTRLHGPSSLLGPAPVRPKVQAPTEKPIESYPHINLIDQLVNSELPHGSKSKAK